MERGWEDWNSMSLAEMKTGLKNLLLNIVHITNLLNLFIKSLFALENDNSILNSLISILDLAKKNSGMTRVI